MREATHLGRPYAAGLPPMTVTGTFHMSPGNQLGPGALATSTLLMGG